MAARRVLPRLERGADHRDRGGEIAKHQLSLDANDAIAQPAQLATTTRIRSAAQRRASTSTTSPTLEAKKSTMTPRSRVD